MKKQQSILKKIKSYEDACAILGKTPLTLEQFSFLGEQAQYLYSVHRVATVIEAVNEGHQFDFDNYSEPKFYPWWYLATPEGKPAGSGFAYYAYGYTNTLANVGARLCTRSEKDAKYVADLMFEDYRVMMKSQAPKK